MRCVCIGLVLAVTACEKAPPRQVAAAPTPGESTTYYVGTTQLRSPKGKVWFEGGTALLREVRPAERVIRETWMRHGALETFTYTHSADDAPTVFGIEEIPGGLYGTVTYEDGVAWGWTRWRYDFRDDDNGKVTGSGSIVGGELTSILDTRYDGVHDVTQVDRVRVTTEAEYRREVERLEQAQPPFDPDP